MGAAADGQDDVPARVAPGEAPKTAVRSTMRAQDDKVRGAAPNCSSIQAT
ncbi:hypothetical protein AB0M54_44040 [Actinoplanes sp. NPDC051470]